jgi:hypothetical protein
MVDGPERRVNARIRAEFQELKWSGNLPVYHRFVIPLSSLIAVDELQVQNR